MSELTFYDKGHIYMAQGERIPAVSDLCRFISREVYGDAPAWKLEAAAIRGTAVHQATEALDREGCAAIEEDYLGYLEAYRKFLTEHEVAWELIEHPDWHEELRYAGTIDRYGMVDGIRTLVDIKTAYAVQKALYGASLNLYRMMLERRGKTVERLLIVHLKKDGTYKLVPLEISDTVAMALITLHTATMRRRRNNGRRTEDQ